MSTFAASDQIALRGQQLSTFYGKSQVLFDVSIDIPQRGVVAVLGRNGAGKTTLLKTLAGELSPSSGDVQLSGRTVTREPTELRVRAGLGYVPQEHAVFARLTVRDNLAVGSLVSPKEGFDRALAIFPKLAGRLDQAAGTLSGGERKMLAIGRAVLGKPKVLMLDEPTEGVWLGVIEEIADRLAELAQDIAIVLVEQNLDLALRLADRVVVMDRGQIVLTGTSGEVRDDPELTRLLAP